MATSTRKMVLPILIAVIGGLWILQVMGVDFLRSISIYLAGALATIGVLVLLVNRRGRGGFVVGVLLLVSAGFWILRITGAGPNPSYEVPAMVCVLGLINVLAQFFEGRGI